MITTTLVIVGVMMLGSLGLMRYGQRSGDGAMIVVAATIWTSGCIILVLGITSLFFP